MKLYYSPGACSMAPHIVLSELALDFDPVKVDLKAKTMNDGGDFTRINPKGAVPTLALDNDEILTENAVILQYLADQKPEANLAPKAGTLEHYRFMEWLNYIATELHKGCSPLFNPQVSEDYKAMAREALAKKLTYVSGKLGSAPFLMGKTFTAADAYLFTVLSWMPKVGLDLSKWPKLVEFTERVSEREAVQRVLAREAKS